MKKLKTAVIGLGQIGNTYDLDPLREDISTHAGAYLANDMVELAGVSDISGEKIDLFKKMRGNFPAYTDYRQLLTNHRIDLLSICTHEDSHLEIAKDAIKSGVKAIFCEKPLCANLEEAKILKQLVASYQIYFSVNISRRWDRALQRVKEYVARDGLGRIQGVHGTYVKGIANTGPHLFDMLRMLFGNIEEVRVLKNRLTHEKDPSPDLSVRINQFNALFTGLDYNSYLSFEIKIFGSKGALTVENSGRSYRLFEVGEHDLFSGFKRLYESEHDFGPGLEDLMANAINDNIERVLQNKPPACGAADGYELVKIVDDVKRQCKEVVGT